jgi:hypothetical protein
MRRRGPGRRRSTTPIPPWATVAIGIAAFWGGIGLGINVASGHTPWPPPPVAVTPLPATPTGKPITPMNLGDTLLLGDTTGITFTATQAADPAAAEHSAPSPGYRYLAVKLTITNTTGSTWHGDGVPTVRSVVIASDGKQYGAVPASTTLAPPFAAHLVLPAGGTATGAVTFQVPATAAITSVQIALTPDAAAIGLWTIS